MLFDIFYKTLVGGNASLDGYILLINLNFFFKTIDKHVNHFKRVEGSHRNTKYTQLAFEICFH